MKKRLDNYYPNISLEHGKSKMNEPNKFFLNFSQRLKSKSSKRHVALQNLFIHYTWKSITQNNSSNLESWIWIAWWVLFSMSRWKLYWLYHKKHEELSTYPSIHIYINTINNGLVFKTKDWNKLELKTPETMTLFGSTK